MGFFTHEAARIIGGRTQYINDTIESVCEDGSIEPCSEDLIEAGFDGIITMNENYNSIMRRMAYAEASALEETGKEFVYTEGVLGDLYNTIKSFLMKIWERIKSLFKRFIMILDSYAKNDKDFAKKYQKEIFSKSGDTSDFTFKGYKWNIDETRISRAILGCVVESAWKFKDENRSDVDTNTIKQYDSKDDYTKNVDKESDNMEIVRAGIYNLLGSGVGYSQQSTLTSEEFRKEFHEFLRSGETEKEELDSKDLDIQAMYNHLITSNKDRKDATKAFNDSKKSIDQDIKALERLHNSNINDSPGKVLNPDGSEKENASEDEKKAAYEKNDLRSKNLAYFAKESRVCKECLMTLNSETLNAMKERSRQYKACLIAYVHYRPSSESAMQESYLIGKEKNVGGNIFGGISFV